MRTTIIDCLKSYVKKYQQEEKRIENGSLLENPAMIGYFEAKDILDLQQRINNAIEYINHRVNVLGQVSISEKELLQILKGEDN